MIIGQRLYLGARGALVADARRRRSGGQLVAFQLEHSNLVSQFRDLRSSRLKFV
jgi:hypothetical protein